MGTPDQPRLRPPLILAFLLAGAILSYLSAWSIEFYLAFRGVSVSRKATSTWVAGNTPNQLLSCESFRGLGYREYHLNPEPNDTTHPIASVPDWVRKPDAGHYGGTCAYGLPFRCAKWDYISQPDSQTSQVKVLHALPLSLPSRHLAVRLPLRPIYFGLIANTLLFASILSAPWTYRIFRHHRRLRRGHCPHCNYNLLHNHTNPCPECGRTSQNKQI